MRTPRDSANYDKCDNAKELRIIIQKTILVGTTVNGKMNILVIYSVFSALLSGILNDERT